MAISFTWSIILHTIDLPLKYELLKTKNVLLSLFQLIIKKSIIILKQRMSFFISDNVRYGYFGNELFRLKLGFFLLFVNFFKYLLVSERNHECICSLQRVPLFFPSCFSVRGKTLLLEISCSDRQTQDWFLIVCSRRHEEVIIRLTLQFS